MNDLTNGGTNNDQAESNSQDLEPSQAHTKPAQTHLEPAQTHTSEVNSHTKRLYLFCEAFFAELAGLGVREAVVSPGSRSTPLALASQALNQTVVLDERSAGFVALGLAKATRSAVVLICTSGTAAANYMPAVVEAFHAQVPLLLLTADRPLAVRHWGASQTINQSQLYGNHVGWFAEVVPPLENTAQAARHFACRALAQASSGAPVHLNWPIDKPLEPPDAALKLTDLAPIRPQADSEGQTFSPSHNFPPVHNAVLAAKLSQLADSKGVLIVGSCDLNFPTAQAVVNFAASAGWPILSEATSGLRFLGSEQVLANGHFLGECEDLLPQPEVVVRVGPYPIDAALLEFLRRHPPAVAISAASMNAAGGWADPDFLAQELWQGDLIEIFSQAADRTAEKIAAQKKSDPKRPARAAAKQTSWLGHWKQADEAAHQALTSVLAQGAVQGLSQAHAVRILSDCLEDDHLLYVASSLAVRDLEFFASQRPVGVRVLANRGANGIDGMISSAIGAALGTSGKVTLLLGDLALLHDFGALILASQLGVSLRIVLLNNNGGGIFDQLPIANRISSETFTKLFTTPHNLEFDFLGSLPGVSYQKATSPADWRQALKSQPEGAVSILEVPCRASAHLKQLDRCRLSVRKALELVQPLKAAALPTVEPPNTETASAEELGGAPKVAAVASSSQPLPSPSLPLPLLHATEWTTAGKQFPSGQVPVVLLHGFMGSIASMRDLVGGLFHDYRVLAVDLPGHGKSLMPPDPEHFSMETAVELLWKTLDSKGIHKAHLVGYSMGGRVALSAGVCSPQRVASLICIGASPGISDSQQRAARRQADFHQADTLLADGLESFLNTWLSQPLFQNLPKRMSAKEFEAYQQQRLLNDPENLAMSLRYMGTGSMAPLHAQLQQALFPCLWLAGEEDQKYRNIALEMAQLMPRGSISVISNSNHAAHIENLPETLRTISNFLASAAP